MDSGKRIQVVSTGGVYAKFGLSDKLGSRKRRKRGERTHSEGRRSQAGLT
jgi:hypothetical protein